VRGETAEVKSVDECASLQLLNVGALFAFHLSVQDFDTVKTHFGSQVDATLDAPQFAATKLPKRVGRNGKGQSFWFCGR
jgi:hypothetical protein